MYNKKKLKFSRSVDIIRLGLMSCTLSNSNNNNYRTDLELFAGMPTLQQFVKNQINSTGSLAGIYKVSYGGSSSSTNSNSYYSGSDSSPTAGSSGKYMVHCYYGSQSGNKVTTVIG